jgi:hypothetical protein
VELKQTPLNRTEQEAAIINQWFTETDPNKKQKILKDWTDFLAAESVAKNAGKTKAGSGLYNGASFNKEYIKQWNSDNGDSNKMYINDNNELVIENAYDSGTVRNKLVDKGIIQDNAFWADPNLDEWVETQSGKAYFNDGNLHLQLDGNVNAQVSGSNVPSTNSAPSVFKNPYSITEAEAEDNQFSDEESRYTHHVNIIDSVMKGENELAHNGTNTTIEQLMQKYTSTDGDENIVVDKLKASGFNNITKNTTMSELKDMGVSPLILANAVGETSNPSAFDNMNLPVTEPRDFIYNGKVYQVQFNPMSGNYILFAADGKTAEITPQQLRQYEE